MSENGANGKNGSSPQRAAYLAGDATEAELEEEYAIGEVPIEVFELAERCRAYVKAAVGIELDYEPETLPLLDEYLRGAAASIKDRPEAAPLITRTVAAYIGEVARRRVDGFWRKKNDPDGTWVVSSRRALLSVSPLAIVQNALARSEDPEAVMPEIELAPPDEALAAARLSALPPVSEEEYRLVSTRVEVIDIVFETLRDQMQAEDRASLVFEESDYEDE